MEQDLIVLLQSHPPPHIVRICCGHQTNAELTEQFIKLDI